jgi:hypothetical protein
MGQFGSKGGLRRIVPVKIDRKPVVASPKPNPQPKSASMGRPVRSS